MALDGPTMDRWRSACAKQERSDNAARSRQDAIQGIRTRDSGRDRGSFGTAGPTTRTIKYKTPKARQRFQADGYTGPVPSLEIRLSHSTVKAAHRSCARCTPISRQFWHPTTEGLVDLTRLPVYRRFGLFHYYLSDICRCSKLRVTDHPDLTDTVLGSVEVRREVEKSGQGAERTARNFLSTISAHSSSLVAKIAGWVLTKVFQFSTSGILVERREIEILREAASKGIPILYLPLHRSHLDYMILMWVLCLSGIPSPFVAAGDNLNITLVGTILRKLGAFFIRRRPGKEHELYKAVLGEYMIELLKQGKSVEFFIEGRRTRSGLINPARVGLLTQVISAVRKGLIGDVLICPLSLTYDKVPEESLTLELQGAAKTAENVLSALWHSITFPFRQHYGTIRVNFSEPFGLSEFVEKAAVETEGVHELARVFGDHVLHAAMETSAVSQTCLLAVLLLGEEARISQTELERRGRVWETVLKSVNHRLPFETTEKGYLSDALDGFRSLLHWEEEEEGEVVVSRVRDTKVDLLLHYYSAPLLTFSFTLSCLSISTVPLIIDRSELPLNQGCLTSSQRTEDQISKKALLDNTLTICRLLHPVVRAVAPCEELDQRLSYDLDSLLTLGVLANEQSAMSTLEMERNRRAANLLAMDDEAWTVTPESYLYVDRTKIDILLLVSGLLRPYLGVAWSVLVRASKGEGLAKEDFVAAVCEEGRSQFAEGTRSALCSSKFHVNGVLEGFIAAGVLRDEGEGVTVWSGYSKQNVNGYLEFIATHYQTDKP